MKTATKIIAVVLVFFLGFFSCIGAIVGVGWYAYSGLTWEQLTKWGFVAPNNGDVFDTEAPSPVQKLTIEKLLAEMKALAELEEGLTLDAVITQYGVNLPEAVEELLVEELRTLPMNELLGPDAKDILLEHISVGTILKFVPEGVLSEPARETLKDKTLKQVVEGNYSDLLADVKLGYLLSVNYQLQDGIYIPVYQNPEQPTLVELIAPLDLGKLLGVITNGGDVLEVVHEAIADVALIQLVESMMAVEEGPLFELLDGKDVGELLVFDEELGTYKLDFLATFTGMCVGDLLGLVPVYAKNNPELLISWNDKDGNQVVGYMRGFASFDLSSLAENENALSDADFLKHMYFGDLLGYVPFFDDDGNITSWETTTGGDVDTTFKNLVNKPVNDLLGGDFSIATLMEGLFLGDLLGYHSEKVDGKNVWYDGETKVGGLNGVIANVDLEAMLDPESGYSFISAFEGNLMGDLLGYTKTEKGWKNGNDDVAGIDEVVANIDIEALLNPDKEYSVANAFNGQLLGDVLGYDFVENKQHWYNGDNPVSVVENAIAEIDMGKLLGHDGEYKITSAFTDTFLGDILGYIRGEVVDGTEAEEKEDRKYVWYEDVDENGTVKRHKLEGVEEEFANYNLYKIIEGKQDIAIDGFKIYELVGITNEHCYVYLDGNPVMVNGERMAVETWFDRDHNRVNGILAAIAEIDIQHIDDFIHSATIANVVEYIQIDGNSDDYYQLGEITTYVDGDYTEKRVAISKATGILTTLASLKVDDLNNSDLVSAKVRNIQIGDVMGWHYADGVWYTDTTKSEVASGALGALANSKVGTINEDIQKTEIGYLLGYTKVGNTWYTTYDKETNTGTPVSGTLSAIVGFKVMELDSKINDLEIGRLLGYTPKADGTWVQVTLVGEQSVETPLTGIMKTIASFKVGTLSTQIEQLKIGELIGWVEQDGIWYSTYDADNSSSNVEADGIMKYFASLTINGMTDNDTVSAIIGKMKVGEALSWIEKDGKWYQNDTDTTPVQGIMQSVAGMQVNGLDIGVNGLTIGSILEWKEHNGVWYTQYDPSDASKCIQATGIMVNLAHLKISDLNNSATVSGAIQNAKLGEAMGWYEKDGKWYTDAGCTVLAKGTMATMAGTPVNALNTRIQTLTVAQALSFDYNEAEKAYYQNGVKVVGIMASIADTPLTGINDKIHNTVAGELLDYVKGDAQRNDDVMTPYDSNNNPDDDIWYHFVTKEIDGVEKQVWAPCSKIQNFVANRTVNTLDSALEELTIGDVVEYTEQEHSTLSLLLRNPQWEKLSIPGFFEAIMHMTSNYAMN